MKNRPAKANPAESKPALFIGRFQPFHIGHLRALKYAAKRHVRLIVVIGSAQKKDAKNPFATSVRRKMLQSALCSDKINAKIKVLADSRSNGKWMQNIKKLSGGAKTVYSNNILVRRLCRRAGFAVVPVPFYKRYKYYATLIRKRMRAGGKWQQLVPKNVVKIIEKSRAF